MPAFLCSGRTVYRNRAHGCAVRLFPSRTALLLCGAIVSVSHNLSTGQGETGNRSRGQPGLCPVRLFKICTMPENRRETRLPRNSNVGGIGEAGRDCFGFAPHTNCAVRLFRICTMPENRRETRLLRCLAQLPCPGMLATRSLQDALFSFGYQIASMVANLSQYTRRS
jgi:hypothetical protein